MKRAICKMCGGHFIPYSPHDHNCPSCESAFDEPDEQVGKKPEKKELDASDVIINPQGGGRIIHRLRRPVVAKCDFCDSPHQFLCDWHDGTLHAKTCDKKLCDVCTTRVGAGDFCPEHAPKLEKPTP